eukprot:2172620-Prymnesium_polylepis.1
MLDWQEPRLPELPVLCSERLGWTCLDSACLAPCRWQNSAAQSRRSAGGPARPTLGRRRGGTSWSHSLACTCSGSSRSAHQETPTALAKPIPAAMCRTGRGAQTRGGMETARYCVRRAGSRPIATDRPLRGRAVRVCRRPLQVLSSTAA